MSISQKLEKCYKNQIENIKNEKNSEAKVRQIGSLVLDVGGRFISAIAKVICCCRKFVKIVFSRVKDNLEVNYNKNKCGRKKVAEKYPQLEEDIRTIIKEHTYTDSHFQTEQLFCNLTINQVMDDLLKIEKYKKGFISRSSLGNLLNKMGYNLKKVKRNKPLKKIKETDDIFANVKLKKEEAFNDENIALISIDTKDKVVIGPYSRKGKSRLQTEACDHELTNNCLISFGILDLKTNQPYFYNFINKPTSEAIVDCIDDYLSDKYQIEIELVYYPPYHSKYNPIERLWARLERMWNGMLLLSNNICNKVMASLTWKNVKAKVKYITKEYPKGIKYTKEVMSNYEGTNIHRDESLKKWSIIITTLI